MSAKPLEPGFRIAGTWAELDGAFRLVYDNYLKSQLTARNELGRRVSMYQTLATTDVLIATQANQVLGTVTLIGDGELGIPMESLYCEEIAQKRSRGIRFAEVGALAQTAAQSDASNFKVLLRLMQLVAHRSDYRGIDLLLIAVHPRHARFYEKYFSFTRFGGLRECRHVCNHPAVALELNLRRLPDRQAVRRAYGKPFPHGTAEVGPLPAKMRTRIARLANQILDQGGFVAGAQSSPNLEQVA